MLFRSPPYLHPRHQATAKPGGGDDGEFYGAGHVGQEKQQKRQAGKQDFLSGTLCPSSDISACGSRCGSTKNRKNKPAKKVEEYRRIPPESMDSSGILELLPRFELGTSSLPMVTLRSFFILCHKKDFHIAYSAISILGYRVQIVISFYNFSSQIVVKLATYLYEATPPVSCSGIRSLIFKHSLQGCL